MLRFHRHGEHYRSAWDEVLAYRIASWKRLFDGDRFELVATFSDRLTLEWFGARVNLALQFLLQEGDDAADVHVAGVGLTPQDAREG